jgi:hypothetical protein
MLRVVDAISWKRSTMTVSIMRWLRRTVDKPLVRRADRGSLGKASCAMAVPLI